MKLVKSMHASMLRFISEFAAEHNLEIVNMDAHGDESTLPSKDFVCMSAMSWDVDEGFLSMNIMFGISTLEDTNLFRLVELVGELYECVLPSMRINAYDADTGEKVGNFVVRNGTRALPVGGSTARPLQYIMVGMLSTITLSPVQDDD